MTGVDLHGLGDNAFNAIYQAWLDHDGIMVIRSQGLAVADQVAFAARFGTVLDPDPVERGHPDAPKAYRVDYAGGGRVTFHRVSVSG